VDSSWDEDLDGTFEVVDDLGFDDVVDEGPSIPPPPATAFARLISALEAVARAHDRGDAIPKLHALLGVKSLEPSVFDSDAAAALAAGGLIERGGHRSSGFDKQVRAWRALLLEESDDMSACGPAPLDEWCADVLSRSMGRPALADGLRRDLRRHGVAAFGMAEAA
jgi:hypothetical protein